MIFATLREPSGFHVSLFVQLMMRTAEPVISSDWNNMLDLTLRQEFRGERLKGTTIDFSADKPTSALQQIDD